jgi:hypothetical protein
VCGVVAALQLRPSKNSLCRDPLPRKVVKRKKSHSAFCLRGRLTCAKAGTLTFEALACSWRSVCS